MSHESYELKAEARERVGKGSARELRRNGKVPVRAPRRRKAHNESVIYVSEMLNFAYSAFNAH